LTVRGAAHKGKFSTAGVDSTELGRILRDLARFNGAMLGHWPVLQWLGRAIKDVPVEQSLTFVDIGCGYGDLLRAVRGWVRKRGRAMKLIGIDLSPQVIDIARDATDAADDIEYQAADVFEFKPTVPIDFVTNSLLTHHLTDEMIMCFFALDGGFGPTWLGHLRPAAKPGAFLFYSARRLAAANPSGCGHDGRISVARSLTRAEWEMLIARAGISRGAVQLRCFMFRFAIGRLK